MNKAPIIIAPNNIDRYSFNLGANQKPTRPPRNPPPKNPNSLPIPLIAPISTLMIITIFSKEIPEISLLDWVYSSLVVSLFRCGLNSLLFPFLSKCSTYLSPNIPNS